MAKQRMVNTRFWDDNYASNLDPIEKLLFLYFLTNTSTNISGVYEIPIKKVANETGIDKEMVEKIINRFSKDNKIFYKDGWVVIKNFIKHQNQKSPKVSKGIVEEFKNVPENILAVLNIGQIDYEENPSLSKRQAVLIRDKFTCKYCEDEIKDNTYELDHIFPKSKGGNDLYTNIALACRTCNQTKLDRTDEEFIGRKIIVESYHAEKALNELKGNESYINKMRNIHPEFSLDVKTITNKYPISTLSHSNTNSNSNTNLTKHTISTVKPEKGLFGEFKKVKLTEEEYTKLIELLGEKNTNILIAELDEYIASKGKKYSSHYATLRTWARRKVNEIKDKGLKNNRFIA